MNTLQLISHWSANPDVLTYPERHFGPNYKTLINFWIYWDSLSWKQLDVHFEKRRELPGSTWRDAERLCRDAAKSIVSREVWYFLNDCENEIVASHILLESGIPLTFLPLTQNLSY
jgi:hypothetical protein